MSITTRIAARTALGVLAIAVAASTAQSQSRQRDADAIRALSDQWQRDIAAQNVDAVTALFTPDAQVMMSHAPVATGSAAIRGVWGEVVKTPGLNLSWTPTKIEVVSPTRAIEHGTYTDSWDTPEGKMRDAGTYITIWHKVNGKWRVALDAANTSQPLPSAASDAPSAAMASVTTHAANALAWSDFTPAGFDPGMKLAVIGGDPAAKGPYVLRLSFPAGYRFPVHWHPGIENLTVVSGPFQLAMGNTADWSALRTYSAGDFIYIPPKHAHFGGSAASGPSVIQLHGIGPFLLNLGAPK
jgi:uncharacterized protein (TIGR02246 family)